MTLFVRDELVSWQNATKRTALQEHQLRDSVRSNVDLLLRRAQGIACKSDREKGQASVIPANQTLLDLISQASNPLKLAQMDISFLSPL